MAELKQRPIKFCIAISSPHWDEEPGSSKISEPLTLGEIIDHQQIDFTDGGYCDWDDIDWEQDTVHYLQYTGIDDKNGTPIFEKDILRGPVITDDAYTFKVPNLQSFHWFQELEDAIEEGKEIELIGNVYANPEVHCDY